MKSYIFITILFLYCYSIQAKDPVQRKIALLPIISNGIDYASTITTESMLRMELSKHNLVNLVSEKKTLTAVNEEGCNDEECARKIGKELNVEQVLLCKLNLLGEKIIVQYLLVETSSGRNILAEQTSALNLDDLEAVMKRVAISVAKQTLFVDNSEVGNIVGQETIETLRKASRYNFGVGFGYLFPSHGYDDEDKSFTINAYFDHEIQDYSIGLMVGARDGLAINIYGNYLFSKADLCPYLGTSLGLHWVSHNKGFIYYDYNYNDNYGYSDHVERSNNGIELGIKGGLRILHTYNVQLFINFEYTMTFNDYDDKAFIFTIGIL